MMYGRSQNTPPNHDLCCNSFSEWDSSYRGSIYRTQFLSSCSSLLFSAFALIVITLFICHLINFFQITLQTTCTSCCTMWTQCHDSGFLIRNHNIGRWKRGQKTVCQQHFFMIEKCFPCKKAERKLQNKGKGGSGGGSKNQTCLCLRHTIKSIYYPNNF